MKTKKRNIIIALYVIFGFVVIHFIVDMFATKAYNYLIENPTPDLYANNYGFQYIANWFVWGIWMLGGLIVSAILINHTLKNRSQNSMINEEMCYEFDDVEYDDYINLSKKIVEHFKLEKTIELTKTLDKVFQDYKLGGFSISLVWFDRTYYIVAKNKKSLTLALQAAIFINDLIYDCGDKKEHSLEAFSRSVIGVPVQDSVFQALCNNQSTEMYELIDKLGDHIARGYLTVDWSFDDADGAVNNLWRFLCFQEKFIIPDYFYSLYEVFDAGEFYHKGDDPNISPDELYTRPLIENILSRM